MGGARAIAYVGALARRARLCLAPEGHLKAIARLAGPDAIVTTDVGQHQMWAAQAYPVRSPRTFLTSGGLGTMGFGLPAAIGAALARPESAVVCLDGDGSLLMNVQELATLAELGLDVTVFVFDNGSSASSASSRSSSTGGASRLAFRKPARLRSVARGFGVESEWVSEGGDTEGPLARALAGTASGTVAGVAGVGAAPRADAAARASSRSSSGRRKTCCLSFRLEAPIGCHR